MKKVISLTLLLAGAMVFAYAKNSPSSGFNSAATGAFGQAEYKDESVNLGTRYVQLKLASTQVKALNTTPVLAVTSPGSGKALIPVSVFGSIDYRTAAYSTTKALDVEYGGSGSGEKVISLPSGFLTASADKMSTGVVSGGISPLENTGLWVHIDSNPTLGDSDVYLRVYYKIAPFPLTE